MSSEVRCKPERTKRFQAQRALAGDDVRLVLNSPSPWDGKGFHSVCSSSAQVLKEARIGAGETYALDFQG